LERRNKELMILGIVLLLIGSVASYYQWTQYETHVLDIPQIVYPYNNVGIILLVAGIIFIALRFIFPLQRTPQQKISSLGIRYIGLFLFGIVLLVTGLVASYYQVTQLVGQPPFLVTWQKVYPYRNVGAILLVVGIIFMTFGFLFPKKMKQETTSQAQQAYQLTAFSNHAILQAQKSLIYAATKDN
jgi:uncharacterized membrane protein